jgi:hypothetical protein
MITVRTAVRASLLGGAALAAALTGTSAAQAAGTPNLHVSWTTPGQFTVTNDGDAKAGSFVITIFGQTAYEYTARYIQVSGLKAGKSATYNLLANYCGGAAPTRDVIIDNENLVTESSEDDNYAAVPLKEKCLPGS